MKLFSTVAIASLLASPALARDSFHLTLGTSVNTIDSEVRVDSKNLPLAAPISLEDDLNFDDQVDISWLSGYWRFADKHRISFEYLPITRNSKATIDEDIEYKDDVIKAGAFVKSDFDTIIYDVNYVYSFYQTDKLELSGTFGLYWMDVDIGIEASGDIQVRTTAGDGDIAFDDNYNNSESVHAPLPLLGIGVNYHITPNWDVNARARYLDVEIGDYSGTIISIAASTNYFFSEYFGIGTAIGYFDLEAKAENSDFRGKFEWSYQGIQAFLSFRY